MRGERLADRGQQADRVTQEMLSRGQWLSLLDCERAHLAVCPSYFAE